MISLQQISLPDLHDLAASRTPAAQQSRVLDDGLPPPFVAARALKHLAAGKSEHWCATFYVVRASDNKIVGSCGFKDEPIAGRVEIGYSIAPAGQRQGVATAAVKLLLQLARKQGASQVLAEILPDNIASSRVVETLNFERVGARVDEAGDWVVEWIAQIDKIKVGEAQNG